MKHIFLAALLAVAAFCAQAQPKPGEGLKPLTPITPEAASLGKFGSVPVSMYTGIPSISIPLYEIKVNGFTMPVSLDYHAGGNKVDDVASWVGMGWTLQAGGVISRQQRGVHDERMIDDYPTFRSKVEEILNAPPSSQPVSGPASLLGQAGYDTESDIFQFSFPGSSGKFFLDPDGNYYMLPKRDNMKLTFKDQGRYWPVPHRQFFARWIITGEDGLKYVFGKTRDDAANYFDIACTDGIQGSSCDNVISVNSWFLNEIILPGGQQIKFVYEPFSYQLQNTPSYTAAVPTGDGCTATSYVQGTLRYSRALRLKEIQYPGGLVEFEPGDNRSDLPGDKLLKTITVSALEGGTYREIKKLELTHSNGDRLVLKQVDEIGRDGVKKPHVFTYDVHPMPARGSYSQDLWGYYNGLDNKTLVPTYYNLDNAGNKINILIGGNRAVNPNYTQAGLLQKITYPTGGSTEFEYENNVFSCRSAYEEIKTARSKEIELQKDVTDISEEFMIDHSAIADAMMLRVVVLALEGCQENSASLNCATLQLQKKNSEGIFQTQFVSVKTGVTYEVTPGTYRIVSQWNSIEEAKAKLRVVWFGRVMEVDPKFCGILDHTPQIPSIKKYLPFMVIREAPGEHVQYSPDFIIGNLDPNISKVRAEFTSGCTPNQQQMIECGVVEVERRNSDGSYTRVLGTFLRHTWEYSIAPGTYRLKGTLNSSNSPVADFYQIVLSWSEDVIPTGLDISKGERFGGGLRIRKVTDYDNVTKRTVVKTYNYDYTLEDGTALLAGVSSGILMNLPVYWYTQAYCGGDRLCNGEFFSAQSQANVLSQDGINVGYAIVTEEIEDAKQEVRFTTALDQPDKNMYATTVYPFVNSTSYEWRRGNQTRQRSYVGSKVSEQEENHYWYNGDNSNPNYKTIRCVKIVPQPALGLSDDGNSCQTSFYFPFVYSLTTETFHVAKSRAEKSSTLDYNSSVVTEVETVYNSSLLKPKQIKTSNSEGEVMRTYIQYADDFSFSGMLPVGEAQGIKNLQDYNIGTAPIELYVTRTGRDGVEYVMSGDLYTYGSNQPVVTKLYQMKLDRPKRLADFVPARLVGGVFERDPGYMAEVSYLYNADLTLKSQFKTDDARKSYLWDYNGQYIVAAADNAAVSNISYTSFESGGKGNFAFSGSTLEDLQALSGLRVYELGTGNINRSNLSIDTVYLLSYWYKTGASVAVTGGTQELIRESKDVKDGWSFRQLKISRATSVALSGSGRIDEVRMHPVNVVMTSYTYKIGVGVSSVTDPNNKIVYYEYDSFNRLRLIRDYSGKIVELYNYRYINQN